MNYSYNLVLVLRVYSISLVVLFVNRPCREFKRLILCILWPHSSVTLLPNFNSGNGNYPQFTRKLYTVRCTDIFHIHLMNVGLYQCCFFFFQEHCKEYILNFLFTYFWFLNLNSLPWSAPLISTSLGRTHIYIKINCNYLRLNLPPNAIKTSLCSNLS